jgi:hypothetical protein
MYQDIHKLFAKSFFFLKKKKKKKKKSHLLARKQIE